MSKTSLLWFRQDLRLQDNPALIAAAENGKILPIYILDDVNAKEWDMGGASRWWLHQSLQRLQKQLRGKLHFFKGDPKKIIPDLVAAENITDVYWNRCYEPWQIKRDKAIKNQLLNNDIKVSSFNSHLLWEPWTVLKKDSTPYKVFTPYYRKGCLQKIAPKFPEPEPKYRLTTAKHRSLSLDGLDLMPNIKWYEGFNKRWSPGTEGAADKLSHFIRSILEAYKSDRNQPSIQGTSLLSPHLHFGEISPRQVWYAAKHAIAEDDEHLDCFLSELGWREFSYYLLFHFPSLPKKNFQPKFDHFPWQKNKQALRAWQQGKTGIPIVDAGMRELWQTGYMHNRVRMIVGSFLTKNLLMHWRDGERWFWDCLLDADLASNSASWQWIGGCGADAAPYFRILNPVTQGERFDPHGDYVKTYCPELSTMPDKYIHSPWLAPNDVLSDADVSLGSGANDNYPQPIVDLKTSRQRALDAFSSIKGLGVM